MLLLKYTFNILLLFVFCLNVVANEVENKENSLNFENHDSTNDKELFAKELHAQLKVIYKRNQFLKYKLTEKKKSLNSILSKLKLLEDKLDYKMQSRIVSPNNTTVTMVDFDSKDDELVRKCDEIVDNYYERKAIQEKKYVQDLFNNGQNDPQWERESETQLLSFIDNNNFSQSEFLDISCTDSVCKMRVQHQSSDVSRQFKNKLRDDPSFDVYDSYNKYDRISGGIVSSFTFLKDSKQVREFVWGK